MKYNRIGKIICLLACAMGVLLGEAQTCHIRGRLNEPGLQNKSITLTNMNTGEALGKTIIADSSFTFDVELQEPCVVILKTEPQYPTNANSYYYLRFVAEPGDIYADLATDSLSGTPLNDQLHQYMLHVREEVAVINGYYSMINQSVSMTEEQRQEWELKADKRISGLLSYIENVFLENKGNAFGAQVLEDYLQYADLSYEEVLALLDGAAPVVTTYQPVSAKLAALERVSHTAPGKPFKDLNLTDYKTGEPITLGEVIDGKVALIDFWASWCGPCRREIPNIKKIHEQYGGKDFVVVGLNVWDRPDGQARVIKDMEMTWTQLTDVTRNATDTYGVEGIPQILLIGKDGVIIARDLRGEDIEKAVKKALGR